MNKQPVITVGGVLVETTDEADDNLVNFIELLQEIDENKATAKLNGISYVGNDGRRIYY
ncbi:MAG TPA: hypothetical protein VGF75_03620 [Candidatus Saccharimonadales bacterium]|jgi:hypothetical protein